MIGLNTGLAVKSVEWPFRGRLVTEKRRCWNPYRLVYEVLSPEKYEVIDIGCDDDATAKVNRHRRVKQEEPKVVSNVAASKKRMAMADVRSRVMACVTRSANGITPI